MDPVIPCPKLLLCSGGNVVQVHKRAVKGGHRECTLELFPFWLYPSNSPLGERILREGSEPLLGFRQEETLLSKGIQGRGPDDGGTRLRSRKRTTT